MKKETITVSDLLKKAEDAGLKAGLEVSTNPVTFKDVHSGQTYDVAEGMCGFAWVNISPARGKFVNYLKKIGKGYTSYQGGYNVPAGGVELGQSITRKEAYAEAFAKVLQDWGIKCYVSSRLD